MSNNPQATITEIQGDEEIINNTPSTNNNNNPNSNQNSNSTTGGAVSSSSLSGLKSAEELEQSASEDDVNFDEHTFSDSADEDEEEMEEEEEEEEMEEIPATTPQVAKRRGRPSNQSKIQQLMQSTNAHLSQITPDAPLVYSADTKVPKRNTPGTTPIIQAKNINNLNKRQRSEDEKDIDYEDIDSEDDDDLITGGNGLNQDGNQNNNSNINNLVGGGQNNNGTNIQQPKPRGRPKANASRSEERKRIQLQQYIQATQGSDGQTTTTTTTTTSAPASGATASSPSHNTNIQYDDDLDEDYDDDDDSSQPKKKTKYKTQSKKSIPNHLDIRPCWFVGCVKADRSLKILRPCLIPTCKTHAIKSEVRMLDALKRGDFIGDESTGAKDRVCGICGDRKDLHHCSNNGCAFGFCNDCVEIAAMKHNNHPTGNKWVCWVCQFVRLKAKEKERTRWAREQLNPGLPNSVRKYRRSADIGDHQLYQQQQYHFQTTGINNNNNNNNQQTSPQGQDKRLQQQQYQFSVDQSGSPNQQLANKRLRKKINNNEVYETRKYTKKNKDEDSAPPSPTGAGGGKFVIEQQGYSTGTYQPPSPNTLMQQQQAQLQQTHQQARQQQHHQQQQNHLNHYNNNNSLNNNLGLMIESVLSPNRETINPVDNFVDQTFNAIKFFSSLSTNAPDEIRERIDNFVDIIMRIKTVRWASDYGLVWRMIEELSNLIKRNLLSSQSIVEMYSELKALEEGTLENMTTNARNVPLERAITMVFENHETAGLIGKECCSTRNALIYSIEVALRAIADYQRDLELNVVEESVRNGKVGSEIEQIEEQIKANLGEIHKFKFQEVELLDSLSKVRGAIAAHESIRDTLQKKASELKVDMLLIKNGISDKEKETKSQQATLENEIYALKLLINMVESIYWIHDYFYETKVGECEKLINNKLSQLQSKLEIQIPNPPNALDNQQSDDNTTTTTTTTTTTSTSSELLKNKFKTIAIYHKICMQHKVPNFHLEKPDRIQVTVECINEYAKHPFVDIFDNPPEVDMRYVMAVHDANYIKKLETSLPPENSEFETHLESDKSGAMVTVESHKDFEGDDDNIYDTFVSHRSIKAALRASGSVCAAVDSVSRSGYTRAFCAIRPPGHHAGRYGRTSDAPSQGYCLINNVAIGAKYASLTAGYSRIAVVDFDVHHGNGTQEILSGDDNFLFISIHVCDEKRYFYPGTGQDVGGEVDEVSGQFEGNILNIGLKRGTGSAVFLNQWMNKIIPRLEAYKPQLIFLSAGFDGHKDDPTNGLKLNEEDYFVITKMIKTVAFKYCKGRIISVLEGGYGIEKTNSLQRCVNSHLKALVEDTDEEIHLANISYGHFSETQETAIPKFNISNFISNTSKRGKKSNLNTINFINNNMNNINNNITNSINNKALKQQQQAQQLQQQQAQQLQQQQHGQQQPSDIINNTTTTTTSSSSNNNNNNNENENLINNPNNNNQSNFSSSSTSSPILSSNQQQQQNNNMQQNNNNNNNMQQHYQNSHIIDAEMGNDFNQSGNGQQQLNNNNNMQQHTPPNISSPHRNNNNPNVISMSGAQRSVQSTLIISPKPTTPVNVANNNNNNNINNNNGDGSNNNNKKNEINLL